MKRSQASSPLHGSSAHTHKKAKVSATRNQGLLQDGIDDNAGEWTKVENRKVKKAKKTETKLDVCIPEYFS